MLIIIRKPGETIHIDGPCEVKVLDAPSFGGRRVRLGIIAADEVTIRRGEVPVEAVRELRGR